MANTYTNAGRAILTNRIIAAGTEPKYIGWGTGAGAGSASSTTLSTEAMSSSNDGSHNTRVTGTSSRVTVSVTNDGYQVTGTVTADAGKTITNMGLFDTNGQAADLVTAPSGGNLFTIFDGMSLALLTGDSIAITAKFST
jgi:hypothetical protein